MSEPTIATYKFVIATIEALNKATSWEDERQEKVGLSKEEEDADSVLFGAIDDALFAFIATMLQEPREFIDKRGWAGWIWYCRDKIRDLEKNDAEDI